MNISETFSFAQKYIHRFSVSSNDWMHLNPSPSANRPPHGLRFPTIDIEGQAPRVFSRPGKISNAKISIISNSSSANIYLGANLRGNISITICAPSQFIWIGDNCSFGSLMLKCGKSSGPVCLGNAVTANSTLEIISGIEDASYKAGVVIADDCMSARNVVIRNTDAHPIICLDSAVQMNKPQGHVLIEPHVWLCDGVLILKDIRIGGCSIVSAGAIVTRDVPRFSVAAGVPAVSTACGASVWARSSCKKHIDDARKFVESLGELRD